MQTFGVAIGYTTCQGCSWWFLLFFLLCVHISATFGQGSDDDSSEESDLDLLLNSALPTAEVEITSSGTTVYGIPTSMNSAEWWLHGTPYHLQLVLANPLDACEPLTTLPSPSSSSVPLAVVVTRGTCTFTSKVAQAQAAGASFVIVVDTVHASYDGLPSNGSVMANVMPKLKASEGGPCLVNCDLAREQVDLPSITVDPKEGKLYNLSAALQGFSSSACADACSTKLCGLTGVNSTHSRSKKSTSPVTFEVCCLVDRSIPMAVENVSVIHGHSVSVHTPSMFLSASQGVRLMNELVSSGVTSGRATPALVVTVQLRSTGIGPFLSSVCIWALGVSVACGAAFYSAWKDQKSRLGEDKRPPSTLASELNQVEFSMEAAVAYIVFAVVLLLGIYALVKWNPRLVIFMILGLFSVATVVSSVLVCFQPFVTWLLPNLEWKRVSYRLRGFRGGWCGFELTMTWARLTAGVLAIALVIVNFSVRHTVSAWIFQDLICTLLCFHFLNVLRLNSMQVSLVLLGSFMLYDIFMVFLSPFIFHESVMVKVATAGTGSIAPSTTNPETCVRVADERMPMLFMFPKLSSWVPGYAMLGLGDVLLPGLLLSFALRFDVSRRSKAGSGSVTSNEVSVIPASGTTTSSSGSSETPGDVSVSSLVNPFYLNRKMAPVSGENCASNSGASLSCRFLVWRDHPHYTVCCVGYGVGLFLAFLANNLGLTINHVKGQPALLYLVPCTLGPLLVFSYVSQSWDSLWKGLSHESDSSSVANGASSISSVAATTSGSVATSANTQPGGSGSSPTTAARAATPVSGVQQRATQERGVAKVEGAVSGQTAGDDVARESGERGRGGISATVEGSTEEVGDSDLEDLSLQPYEIKEKRPLL